jgi:phosphoribosylformylglycinamidine cyclo-ligase
MKPANGLTYAESGVDIDAGERLVERIKPIVKRTHGPRVMGQHGAFAAMFRLDFDAKIFKRNYRDPVLVACTDGVGTKVKLAIDMGVVNTIGIDCVAMNVNDLIVQGAEPLFFLDYLGLHRQDPEITASIIEGVARGCELSDCALVGGECAEMPDIYAEHDFDIAGFAVGVVELARAVDPVRAQAGDVLLGLQASGVHSNGYSLVRKIISRRRLKLDKVQAAVDDTRSLGEVLLEPTRIYARSIVSLLRRYRVKKVVSAMAHITGGGIPGNLPRVLPEGLDALVDTHAWEVPPVFRFLQDKGGVDDAEMWRVFNMGIGYVLAVRPAFADSITRHLKKHGEVVHRIGRLAKGRGRVQLKGA